MRASILAGSCDAVQTVRVTVTRLSPGASQQAHVAVRFCEFIVFHHVFLQRNSPLLQWAQRDVTSEILIRWTLVVVALSSASVTPLASVVTPLRKHAAITSTPGRAGGRPHLKADHRRVTSNSVPLPSILMNQYRALSAANSFHNSRTFASTSYFRQSRNKMVKDAHDLNEGDKVS